MYNLTLALNGRIEILKTQINRDSDLSYKIYSQDTYSFNVQQTFMFWHYILCVCVCSYDVLMISIILKFVYSQAKYAAFTKEIRKQKELSMKVWKYTYQTPSHFDKTLTYHSFVIHHFICSFVFHTSTCWNLFVRRRSKI